MKSLRVLLLVLMALVGLTAQVPYEATFRAVAGPRWVDRAAQVKAESLFQAKVTAPDGGMGLAQFMPSTWSWAQDQGWVPRGASAYEPSAALTGQHAYMTWLEARVGGRLDPALGAYNAGLGSVRKAQLLAAQLGLQGQAAWLQALPRVTGERNASITRGYLARNLRYRIELGGDHAPH